MLTEGDIRSLSYRLCERKMMRKNPPQALLKSLKGILLPKFYITWNDLVALLYLPETIVPSIYSIFTSVI